MSAITRMYSSVTQFLSEVSAEMRKIQWPSYSEFVGSCIVTVVLVTISSVILFAMDSAIGYAVKNIFAYSLS